MINKFFKNSTPEQRRRSLESTATFGLILVCVSLIVPFFNPGNLSLVSIFKWIYAAGALIFLIARLAGANDPKDSMRVRRLRRLEFWAGIAFAMAAGFWFYEEHRLAYLGPYAGVLAILRNTIMFSLVGALIQLIASWMIVAQNKKEQKASAEGNNKKKR